MHTPLQNTRAWMPVIRASDELFSPRVVERALKSVDLSRRIIEGPPIFIPYALVAAFAENVARQTGERHFGPLVTARYGYEGLDLYGKYVLGAPRLDMALVRGIRAFRFLQTGSHAALQDAGEFVVLQFESGINSVVGAGHVDEGVVVLLVDLVRHFAGSHWQPEWIEIPSAFSNDPTLETIFGVPIRWGAALPGIAIRKDSLQTPNLNPAEATSATLYGDLKAMIQTRPPKTMAALVQDVMVLLAAKGEVSEDAVASWLGLGTRTLQRRLASEGSSFREVLASFQVERASALLLETDHSVREIASALGYREVKSFRRAFRKWTGKTPTEFAAMGPIALLA
ncbi:helix-turn-helix domain-containing protein [Aliiruegeria lutimaris]|uniref:Helix-turn-helix domain-containing protein n=1 Tax=Aliiruegeria lutimaris TaxID=571298 RepID=A0A1G8UKA6_9RHOB|nr:AraC family transcriptional regulator [Aliiruegeria lutimaris]SDJ54054.1 Helix-turn-helix domain-containing protein [Aliiruegeria lutimaris]